MTTLLVATTGGHLAELAELAPRLGDLARARAWVTFDTPQSRSLLAGEPVHFIPFIAERDVVGIARGLRRAWPLVDPARIRAVISTGSAIALAFLPLAARRRIPAHYIETATRFARPSLTGRLLARIPGVTLYRQNREAAGGRWHFAGSVFDGFEVCLGPARPVRRVVVTLGTVDQSFRRLLGRLRNLLPAGTDVLWQTGHTPTDGLGIEARRFVPAAELQAAMRAADVVIAHGGCGSALDALKAGRLPILVPRDPGRGELVDGHQPQLTAWLAARGLALDRSPETLTLADLEAAAAQSVVRAGCPPPVRLITS